MNLKFVLFILLLFSCTSRASEQADLSLRKTKIETDQKVPSLKVDEEYEQTLKTILSVNWKNRQLRDGIRSLVDHYQISILLDRRINPNRLITLDFQNGTLLEFLEEIARQNDAEVSVLANLVYIGPAESARSLRTLLELKQEELKSNKQRKNLSRKINLHWHDLDQPGRIVKNLLNTYQVEIVSGNVPHDLWTSGTVPKTDFSETISFILIQYDLTYEWDENGKMIKLVPVSYPVTVNRSHRVTGKQQAEVLPEFQNRDSFPEMTINSGRVSFTGTLEQHELFENRLRGKQVREPVMDTKPIPLSQRRFTLNLKDGTAQVMIGLLKTKGIQIQYDPEQLRKAGIDLDQKIAISLSRATIKELLESFCKPLGIRYEIRGETILLEPSK